MNIIPLLPVLPYGISFIIIILYCYYYIVIYQHSQYS